ncbi:MAG: HAD family phosphatase [Paludibacter sp.]
MNYTENISTIIFDFGGVLINLDLDRCIKRFNELGVKNFEENLSNFGQKGFFLQFEKGEIGVSEFCDNVRKYAALALTDQQIIDAWCLFLVGISDYKIEVLLELKKKYRILLLSNTNPLHIEISAANEFARFGLKMDDVFEKSYLSYEMKMAKPDAEIFQALLKDAKVKPEECLFLDDGPKNIEQATKLGIQSYLVDVNEDLRKLVNSLKLIVEN